MGRIIDPDELSGIATAIKDECEGKIDQLYLVENALDDFIEEKNLSGQSYGTAKGQMSAYKAVVRLIIMAYCHGINEADELYNAVAGETEVLDEEEINNTIISLNAEIERLNEIQEALIGFRNDLIREGLYRGPCLFTGCPIQRNKDAILCLQDDVRRYEEKLERLDNLDTATSLLFIKLRTQLITAQIGVDGISGAFSVNGFASSESAFWYGSAHQSWGDAGEFRVVSRKTGISEPQFEELRKIGYTPRDVLAIYNTLITEADIEFFRHKMYMNFDKAFGDINPEYLSPHMALFMADFSGRLLANDPYPHTRFIEFNNALLGAERVFDAGRRYNRDVFLEMMSIGSVANAEILSFALASDDLTERQRQILSQHLEKQRHMAGLWSTQSIIVEALNQMDAYEARNFRITRLEFCIEDSARRWVFGMEYQSISYRGIKTISGIETHDLLTGERIDSVAVTAQIRRLNSAHENFFLSLGAGAATLALGVAIPKAGIPLFIAEQAFNGMLAMNALRRTMNAAEEGLFDSWFRSGGSFFIDFEHAHGTLSGTDNAFIGFVDPDTIRNINLLEQIGFIDLIDDGNFNPAGIAPRHLDSLRESDSALDNTIYQLLTGGFSFICPDTRSVHPDFDAGLFADAIARINTNYRINDDDGIQTAWRNL